MSSTVDMEVLFLFLTVTDTLDEKDRSWCAACIWRTFIRGMLVWTQLVQVDDWRQEGEI